MEPRLKKALHLGMAFGAGVAGGVAMTVFISAGSQETVSLHALQASKNPPVANNRDHGDSPKVPQTLIAPLQVDAALKPVAPGSETNPLPVSTKANNPSQVPARDEWISWFDEVSNQFKDDSPNKSNKLDTREKRVVSMPYDSNDTPVAITRGQYADIVSDNMPSSLPTRAFHDGFILYGFEPGEVNESLFAQALAEARIPGAPLCSENIGHRDLNKVRRISIFLSDSTKQLQCLQALTANLQASPKLLTQKKLGTEQKKWGTEAFGLAELSVVTLGAKAHLAATRTGIGPHLTLQQWNFDWLGIITKGTSIEPSAIPEDLRALRLAAIARAFGASSDVRVSLPLKKQAGALEMGNFSVIPLSLASGSVKALRLTRGSGSGGGRDNHRAREALGHLDAQTRALIISGSERTLRIEAELAL